MPLHLSKSFFLLEIYAGLTESLFKGSDKVTRAIYINIDNVLNLYKPNVLRLIHFPVTSFYEKFRNYSKIY